MFEAFVVRGGGVIWASLISSRLMGERHRVPRNSQLYQYGHTFHLRSLERASRRASGGLDFFDAL